MIISGESNIFLDGFKMRNEFCVEITFIGKTLLQELHNPVQNDLYHGG
jgi:hypothetical protein